MIIYTDSLISADKYNCEDVLHPHIKIIFKSLSFLNPQIRAFFLVQSVTQDSQKPDKNLVNPKRNFVLMF